MDNHNQEFKVASVEDIAKEVNINGDFLGDDFHVLENDDLTKKDKKDKKDEDDPNFHLDK